MRDVVEEHLDEARFLRKRRQRVFAVLHGNAAHQRALEQRMDAHLDALASDPASAMALWEEALRGGDGDAWYAAAAAWARSDAAAGLWGRWSAEAPAVGAATRDVLWFYGRPGGVELVEAWLAGVDAARQAMALAVLVRWGDPRLEALGRWALGSGDEGVRAEGLHALAVAGVREAAGWGAAVLGGVKAPALRTGVLEDVARLDAAAALALARSLGVAELAAVDGAAVLRGAAGTVDDAAALEAAWAAAPTAAVAVGLALAGAAGALDGAWARSEARAVSNALREAAYVVLGDEVPPGGVGLRAKEDATEADARVRENAALGQRMRAAGGGPGRWGGQRAEGLSARHRRWAALVAAVDGGPRAEGDWEGL